MIKKITIFFLCLMMVPTLKGFAFSDMKISIEMHYLVVSPAEDGSASLMNMVNYTNTTAEEYKGDGKTPAVLNVTLPEGAADFQFLDDKMKIEKTGTGFFTKDPLPANQTVVLPYSYKVAKGKEINLKLDYPVQQMQVLVPEGAGSVEFKGVEATNQGMFNFEDQKYVGYSVEGIQANQTITMLYDKDKQPAPVETGNPEAKKENEKMGEVTKTAPDFHNPGHLRIWAQSPLRKFDPHILMIVLGAILISGISYFSYFRWKGRQEDERIGADKEEKAFKQLMAKQKAIMDKILELEETHGNGQLTEQEYEAKLQAYKQHLVQVKLSLRKYVE